MIPLSVPVLGGNEWDYVKECLDTAWVSSAGSFVDRFERDIAAYTGASHAVACVNGTAALQVSLRLAGVEPGDEVIVPTITFIAPVNAVTYNGATPVFMDCDRYCSIDEEKTVDFILDRTSYRDGESFNKATGRRIGALIAVHVFGNAARLERLQELCRERGIALVEDAAESLGTSYAAGRFEGRHTGTVGLTGSFSFNGNKIITSGGGGMIVTDDDDVAEKARYLTQQAKDDAVRFIHNEIGYNFRLTNIQAALGTAQLELLDGYLERKRAAYESYRGHFEAAQEFEILPVPDYARNNHWMIVLSMKGAATREDRDQLIDHLNDHAVQVRPVWLPNHLQKPFEQCESYRIEEAGRLVDRSICLPSSVDISEEQIEYVVRSVLSA